MRLRLNIKMNIKKRLIVSFAAILLIPGTVIGWISFETAKSKVDQQMSQAANQSVQLVDQTINKFLEPEIRDVDFLSQRFKVDQFQGQDSPLVREVLDQFQALHPEIQTTYVGTDTGLMIMSPNQKLPDGYDPRKRPWYQQAMEQKGKVVITEPYVDAITGDVVVTFAKTLKDGSGVVALDLKLNNLAEIVKPLKIGQEGYAFILSKEAKFLIHPTAKPGTDAQGDQRQIMYSKDAGEFQYQYEGELKKMVFATNKLTGWKIAGTWYVKEVNQEAAPIFNRMLLVVAISTLIGALLVYLIIRSVTQPLKKLIEASDRISQGDLTRRIEVRSKDELGQLGESFNKMADSLRSVLTEVGETAIQLAASSEELTASAEQTSKATEQIASTIQEVALGTEQQVHHVKESAKAVNEMSAGVRQIATNAQNVSATAMRASEISAEGGQAIQTAVRQMNSIHLTVNGLAQSVKELGNRSQEIGKIVEVITGIAEQTNLLALNAAIEAARAGEHGRGFAVVADEVRKLAEQSAQSAQQIGELIQTIQAETDKAVQSMETATQAVAAGIGVVDQAGRSFDEIQRAVNEVAEQIQEGSAAAQQISAGTGQVVQAIETISEVTETTAAGTQNVSAAAEEQLASMQEITASAATLAKMAEELQSLVQTFKV
ncbi:methyl-accepting chemotaxis protein [Effusibacillus pohliae]|uniref:methyl-accepting chemotaxis protein n=1 Tax=Effusibacillus pohliae TaxID=232270 RepID=UPI0003688C31|nr:methyl-accepting chemotaxis protein [Effusibacillus pohliae]